MIITPDIEIILEDVIKRYIPPGTDMYLHINRQAMMKIICTKLIEGGVIATTPLALAITCRNWQSILYERAIYLN